MKKGSLFNGVLALAVVILFILQFSGNNKQEVTETVEITKDSISSKSIEEVPVINLQDSLGLDSVSSTFTSKIGYFNLESLVKGCGFLNRKESQFGAKENGLYKSKERKEKELEAWYRNKERQIGELAQKGLANQDIVNQAQSEFMQKQQKMQMDLAGEEERFVKEKREYAIQRDEIIYKAIKDLNEIKKLDYVLVDSYQSRLVVPMNEKNNITSELIKIINKRHK